jgi:hypothetical protein
MDKLLTHTESLLNQVYWFKQDFNLEPSKEHIGSAIEWTDIEERKHDFLKELVSTVSNWVYSKEKSKKILDERLITVSGDFQNAFTFLTNQAYSKFRPGYPQGQFGELLLFNFIQHFFGAVPLLRKQRITTSIGHERFGADAVHYKKIDTNNIIILGESKCYMSKYQFNEAFKTSLSSITNTVEDFNKELDLYTYDDFIEPELEDIAKKYKLNTLENVHFEMVCLVAYNETKKINGLNESEIKDSIKKIIESRCASIDSSYFTGINKRILSRINYIIFPIWELDALLNDFMKRVGTL